MSPYQDIETTLITATAIPISLFITLVVVHAISYLWYVGLARRALPVVVNDIGPDPDGRTGQSGPAGQVRPAGQLQDLPCLLREYAAADQWLTRQLAPGTGGTVSPEIPSAAPAAGAASWPAALLNLVLPQKQAAYNIHLTPHNPADGLFTVSVQVVKTPGQWIVATRTFTAGSLAELVAQAGGFAMESVQLQPGYLRRTPRWEQWGSRGGYGLFRRAVSSQEAGDIRAARLAFDQAAKMAPGNIAIGLHRASLYELEGRYSPAALLYDSLHYLWQKNIEVAYRAAVVRVNLAQEIRGHQDVAVASLRSTARTAGLHAAERRGLADSEVLALRKALRLLDEAEAMFNLTAAGLRFRNIVPRLLCTLLPSQRDVGELRYWISWLRRDNTSQPNTVLRRTKRREYANAVRIALESCRLLRLVVQSEIKSCLSGTPERPEFSVGEFDIDRSVRSVLALITERRAGWLAHWAAACYFSRAALAADLTSPADWRKIENQWNRHGFLGSPAAAARSSSWRECCEDIAIGEIGRVLRNPSNPLNTELLETDPDMKRLHLAVSSEMVRVLIGSARDYEQLEGM